MEDPKVVLEYQKMELQVYLSEYNQLRSEIKKRLDYIDKVVYYYIIILLGMVTASKLLEKIDDYFVLSTTLSLNILGIYYATNLYLISKLNKYLAQELKLKITQVTKSIQVLGWEVYILKQDFINNSNLKAGLLFTYYWVLMIPTIITFSLFSYKIWHRIDLKFYHLPDKVKLLLSALNIFTLYISFKSCSISRNVYDTRHTE